MSFRQEWLTNLMKFLSLLGSDFIIFGSIVIIIFLTLRKHRKESFIFLLLLIMGAVATTTLKLLFKIPRPEILPLEIENSFSYPSGHTLNSFIFYGTISYFMYHFTKKIKASIAFLLFSLTLIFFIGISRVYLGVHYPSDVGAGYVLGFSDDAPISFNTLSITPEAGGLA